MRNKACINLTHYQSQGIAICLKKCIFFYKIGAAVVWLPYTWENTSFKITYETWHFYTYVFGYEKVVTV